MKVLLGYRDIMELGVSKKTAYKMLNLICETDAYKKVKSIQSDRYKESSDKVIYQDVS